MGGGLQGRREEGGEGYKAEGRGGVQGAGLKSLVACSQANQKKDSFADI